MDIGKISVLIGLASSLTAIVAYLVSLRGNKGVLRIARLAYAVSAVSAVASFGRLMWLVVHRHYEYAYVFEHTSDTLIGSPFHYAATWAGQEGSFLLWLFWGAIIGCLVAWKAGKWESRVMPFYALGPAFLFGILVWLSPYNLLPRGGANGYPLDLPWPPNFGQGLNPSLQNYWMAIHPPTIFFGFASLAVPFAYAIAAMIWREYDSFATRVMPWVLMTTVTLGVGLFMGGYWAYETQGWHGFWGWDPVENASLFPWLGGLALLHGLVVQKSRGGMGRTNLFLAILSWNMFLYGTFLTRSGVLSEASVHSFVSLASRPLYLLIVMMATYSLGGLALWLYRYRSIPGRPISDRLLSRDTLMVTAVTIMIALSLIITFGTSWPLLSTTKLFSHFQLLKGMTGEKGALTPLFFNRVGSIFVIPTLIVMGMVPFVAWGKTNVDKFLWKAIVPWFMALGVGVLVLVLIWRYAAFDASHPRILMDSEGFPKPVGTPAMLVVSIATLGAFAAFANLILSIKVMRAKAVTMGGWLAHVGIGVMLLGTVLTNVYERTENQTLVEGAGPAKTSFGYSLQFAGWTHDDTIERASKATDPAEREKLIHEAELDMQGMGSWMKFDHAVKIRVIPDKDEAGTVHADDAAAPDAAPKGMLVTVPVFHYFEGDKLSTMTWPHIKREFDRDFYLVAASAPEQARAGAMLLPGETSKIELPGLFTSKYLVKYEKFYMQGAGGPGTVMGAEMTLITPEGKRIPIKPGMSIGNDGPQPVNVDIPGMPGSTVQLEGGRIDPATKQAKVTFVLPDAPAIWVAHMAVTNKPWVNLVWAGIVIMGIGTIIAMFRRSIEARKGARLDVAEAAGVTDEPLAVPAAAAATATAAVPHRRRNRSRPKAAAGP